MKQIVHILQQAGIARQDDNHLPNILKVLLALQDEWGCVPHPAVPEIACNVMTQDFRMINPRETRTVLVEAGPRILPSFPDDLSTKAETFLGEFCVEVRKHSPLTSIQSDAAVIGTERITTATVLWAAGVTASPLARSLEVPLDRAGRVLIEPDLSIPGHPEVCVIGDLATFTHQTGVPLPGLAPVAIQQGRHAARNILCRCQRLPSQPFRYADRGSLTTIGQAAAVARFGRLKLSGFPAWIVWSVAHIFFLIGFRNRVMVFLEWVWAYVARQRSARLITGQGEWSGPSGQ